jgi:hypothetical protein
MNQRGLNLLTLVMFVPILLKRCIGQIAQRISIKYYAHWLADPSSLDQAVVFASTQIESEEIADNLTR